MGTSLTIIHSFSKHLRTGSNAKTVLELKKQREIDQVFSLEEPLLENGERRGNRHIQYGVSTKPSSGVVGSCDGEETQSLPPACFQVQLLNSMALGKS